MELCFLFFKQSRKFKKFNFFHEVIVFRAATILFAKKRDSAFHIMQYVF